MNSVMQNCLQNRPGVKSELFQELEDQCYPVLKLEDEIQTFAIVGGPKVHLTLNLLIIQCTTAYEIRDANAIFVWSLRS